LQTRQTFSNKDFIVLFSSLILKDFRSILTQNPEKIIAKTHNVGYLT